MLLVLTTTVRALPGQLRDLQALCDLQDPTPSAWCGLGCLTKCIFSICGFTAPSRSCGVVVLRISTKLQEMASSMLLAGSSHVFPYPCSEMCRTSAHAVLRICVCFVFSTAS